MTKVLCTVGARPNFVKVAPVVIALKERGVATVVIHTGQHFDPEMSDVFFGELGLPQPDVNLEVGRLPAVVQTARIVEQLGAIIEREQPDWVVVPGDVNSTLAAAVATVRCGRRLAHLEAGLRSFDRAMPEELNRVATDHLSDLLLATERSALRNLAAEGIPEDRVALVGNTMIDTLLRLLPHARARPIRQRLGLREDEPIVLVTAHRPSNVDGPDGLDRLVRILEHASAHAATVFPVHPRTRCRLLEHGGLRSLAQVGRVHLTEPLGYLDFVALMDTARVVLTDSGGVQEETTALGRPCLTIRDTTERPVTCEVGTNAVVGTDPGVVARALEKVWTEPPGGRRPELWDGHAAGRAAEALLRAT
ncbi:MAG: UDP-N-acetylglucosamine 2-epimerase (non-hydrolyzing) [Candidatus Rokubacteria bacterium]|nr:UDP-N-acetylglucosamine 2-epimerase (non-hydrolyzing) [Candidatus Rokubacteria bacterium]